MQADEEVGKIALATPVLICRFWLRFVHKLDLHVVAFLSDEVLSLTLSSRLAAKALEIFLQDLCDRSYEVTKGRGAKTVSVPHV